MKREQIQELLLQALEIERRSALVYQAALDCALNDDLRAEWSQYLVQTQRHEQIVSNLLGELGLGEGETPGRRAVRAIGDGLVAAIRLAETSAAPEDAQILACECVVLAETQERLDWELISELARAEDGPEALPLDAAARRVVDDEDEHLSHNAGWCRELWLARLGMRSALAPGAEEPRPAAPSGRRRAPKPPKR